MCYSFPSRLMYNYLFLRYTVLYFICSICLNILCHTVVNSSDLVSPHQNESLSQENKIEQFKRDDRKQENIESENKSRNLSTSDNKVVSPNLNNSVTVHNKPSVIEDQLNATASLPPWMLKEGALQRTGFVALGFMSIVLIFFAVRAVRLRQKKSKSRKYGIITSTASDMEMEPLDKDDDEEEDTTLFDAQHKYSLH